MQNINLLQLCQPALNVIFSWDSLRKMTIESRSDKKLLKIGIIYSFTGDKNIEDEVIISWDCHYPKSVLVEAGAYKLRMPIDTDADKASLNETIVEILD